MSNEYKTLGEWVKGNLRSPKRLAGQALEYSLGWAKKNKKSLGLALAATATYALYQGWMNPTNFDLTDPNFTAPGQDTQWAMYEGILGWLHSSASNYLSNGKVNGAIVFGSGVLQSVARKIGSIKLNK